MLVRGLLASARTMLYTLGIVVIILYVFACLSMELITTDEDSRLDPEFDRYVELYFKNIWISMLTLLQFVNDDSVAAIYSPMVQKNPILIAFFVLIIMIVPIALMNLVTAVIVEGSLQQATQDREVAKAYKNSVVMKMMPKIEMMFEKLDTDGNGDITLSEIEAAPQELADELARCFQTDDIIELFEILDIYQTGNVSIKEFCQELVKVVTSERSVEQVRMQKNMIALRNNMNEVRNELRSQKIRLPQKVDEICGELNTQKRQIEAMQGKLDAIHADMAAVRAFMIAPKPKADLPLPAPLRSRSPSPSALRLPRPEAPSVGDTGDT